MPPVAVRMPWGREHAADVLGAGLAADEDDLHSVLGLLLGVGRVEHELAGRGAGDGVDARGDLELLELGGADRGYVDDRVEDALDLLGADAGDGLGLGDEAFVDHVDGHLEGGRGEALAGAALEHVELLVLDRELEVLHLLEVLLEGLADLAELLVGLGELGLELDELHRGCGCRPRRPRPGR